MSYHKTIITAFYYLCLTYTCLAHMTTHWRLAITSTSLPQCLTDHVLASGCWHPYCLHHCLERFLELLCFTATYLQEFPYACHMPPLPSVMLAPTKENTPKLSYHLSCLSLWCFLEITHCQEPCLHAHRHCPHPQVARITTIYC